MSKILIVFFSLVFMMIWLLIYKRSYDSPRKRKRITLWIGSHFRGDAKRIYYFAVLILYLGLPMLFGWLLLRIANVPYAEMFTVNEALQFSPVYLSVLSFIGGVTLSILATNIMLTIAPKMDIPSNINKVAWIESTMEFPKQIAWIFPFSSACIEELFFRGACFFAFTGVGINPYIAMIIVTIMFVFNQVYLVDNKVQAIVIGVGSMFLSILGCFVAGLTGTVIPSMIAHAIYAVFFIRSNDSFDAV